MNNLSKQASYKKILLKHTLIGAVRGFVIWVVFLLVGLLIPFLREFFLFVVFNSILIFPVSWLMGLLEPISELLAILVFPVVLGLIGFILGGFIGLLAGIVKCVKARRNSEA